MSVTDDIPRLSGGRRAVEVGGVRTVVHYVDVGASGDRPVVLLVHGLGGRWQHWQRVIPAIGKRWRVLAVDLPGFGDSEVIAKQFDLSLLADVLGALLRNLGIERVVFVGHSFGGPLGITFAVRHGGVTEQLVLVAGTVQSFQQTLARRFRPWLARPLTAVATIAELLYTGIAVPRAMRPLIARSRVLRRLALRPFVWAPQRLSPADVELLIHSAGAPGVMPTAHAIARATGWEHLAVDLPVALINGDHDLIAPLEDLRAYPGRVDRALVVKGTGHLPMIEAPEAFVAALDQALKS